MGSLLRWGFGLLAWEYAKTRIGQRLTPPDPTQQRLAQIEAELTAVKGRLPAEEGEEQAVENAGLGGLAEAAKRAEATKRALSDAMAAIKRWMATV